MRTKLLWSLAPILAALAAPAIAEPASPTPPQDLLVGPALYISDPAKSVKFYIDGLGMKVRIRFGPKDCPDTIVGFGMDMTQSGIMLLTDKAGPVQRPIEHAHGFDRIALRVTDLAIVAARLRAAGFEAGEIRVVHGSVQMMIVTDPDGYQIELIDSKPAPRKP